MSMFSSRAIGIPADYKNPYNAMRIRVGKTKRDALNGNAKRNAERKESRADWQKNASKTNPPPFPV